MLKAFKKPLFSVRRHLITIARWSNFSVSDIFFGSYIWRFYIRFGFSFEFVVVVNCFSNRSNSQFVNVSSFSFFSISILSWLFIFIGRWFSRIWLIFPVVLSFQLATSILQSVNNQIQHSLPIVRKNKFCFCKNLSFPTGTRTSLQVEYNSYVLVGGIGSLLLYCISSSVSLNCYYRLSMCLLILTRAR